MNKPDPLWVKGVPGSPSICDRILGTLKHWKFVYHKGSVSAKRKQNQLFGKEMKVVDVPTRYANKIAWRQSDLEYLIKILEAKCPDWPITKDFRRNFPKWKYGQIVPGGGRIIEIDLYFQSLCQIISLMEAIRDGKVYTKPEDLADIDLEKISE